MFIVQTHVFFSLFPVNMSDIEIVRVHIVICELCDDFNVPLKKNMNVTFAILDFKKIDHCTLWYTLLSKTTCTSTLCFYNQSVHVPFALDFYCQR